MNCLLASGVHANGSGRCTGGSVEGFGGVGTGGWVGFQVPRAALRMARVLATTHRGLALSPNMSINLDGRVCVCVCGLVGRTGGGG